MVKVELLAHTNVEPMDLASFAALGCYQSEEPEWGKRIDIKDKIFSEPL
jgi:hypothetical protein